MPKPKPITLKKARDVFENIVVEFIHAYGNIESLTGADRFHALELADALERVNYPGAASLVREHAVKMTYPRN